MGFFKDMRQLEKVGNERRETQDVGAEMADAQTKMAAAQEMMARRTRITNAQAMGVPARVTVTGAREVSSGGDMMTPSCEVDLTVMPAGLPPYPATIGAYPGELQAIAARPGPSLGAKVDPNDPTAIWMDYGSPAT